MVRQIMSYINTIPDINDVTDLAIMISHVNEIMIDSPWCVQEGVTCGKVNRMN